MQLAGMSIYLAFARKAGAAYSRNTENTEEAQSAQRILCTGRAIAYFSAPFVFSVWLPFQDSCSVQAASSPRFSCSVVSPFRGKSVNYSVAATVYRQRIGGLRAWRPTAKSRRRDWICSACGRFALAVAGFNPCKLGAAGRPRPNLVTVLCYTSSFRKRTKPNHETGLPNC